MTAGTEDERLLQIKHTKLRKHLTGATTLKAQCGVHTEALQRCLQSNGLPLDPLILASMPEEQASPCIPFLHAFQECGRDVLYLLELTRTTRCHEEVAAARLCNEDRARARRGGCNDLELSAMLCFERKRSR
eukprot:CAMPEP_0119317346 /NCGR_PEP_ID=MMETSP1333-20130426/42877_1 /TAXON_ID=418940 /ORGANISM="Scyphosphaera apsteinii, Strain RCC1455" /LENGTH=131 /DNA_ID=CAMNT_0007323253 /DNA_START=93 /DNA_END=488 /DNA_ORIENTATION=-